MTNPKRQTVFALAAVLAIVGVARAADAPIPYTSVPGDPLRWYDARDLDVEGRGFTDVAEYYDRLPAKAEGVVRGAVWGLSRNSSGMCVRFVADSPSIAVRWSLRSPNLSMPHMAATGVSGVDLYGRTDDGAWRWIAVGKPTGPETTATLASTLPPGRREYRVYLPLYNGVKSVAIGLPESAAIAKTDHPSAKLKPVVFYGTSIMQGACASRTGMSQSSIVGRRLDRPIINLGFSGNGKMEIEVARLLAELDPAAYVLDALPNCDATEVKERTEPLVIEIRKAHPNTPIVLVEDRTYADAHWNASRKERNVSSRREYRAAYERLLKDGVTDLTYVEGDQLLNADGEDTVDGSHPTDLGFARYADVLTPVLKKVLSKP
jgi:hypothetical protein